MLTFFELPLGVLSLRDHSGTAKRRAATARAAEVEQIDSKAKHIDTDEGAGVPVLRSKCRI